MKRWTASLNISADARDRQCGVKRIINFTKEASKERRMTTAVARKSDYHNRAQAATAIRIDATLTHTKTDHLQNEKNTIFNIY